MLFLAVVGISGAAMIGATGGIDTSLFGIAVSARNPLRTLLVGSVALTLYILSGGEVRLPGGSSSHRLLSRLRQVQWPRTLAVTLAAMTAVLIWVYGAKAVGGADSYGYMSQSELWAEGLPKRVMPIIAEVPWPQAAWTFSPVGAYRPMHSYRQVSGPDRWTIVPVYPPGLPLLLTAAGAVGGFQAKFMVVPLLAGVLVLATYGIGARLVSPVVGLMAAWLVATSPPVLFIAVTVMSDVPAAALWSVAFFFVLGRSTTSAAIAGATAGFAVLVRPNLAPLVAILGLRYLYEFLDPATRRAAFSRGSFFALTAMVPIGALGVLHYVLYGSPTASGYGVTEGFFSRTHVVPNLRRYFGWFVESHTVVGLAGFAALAVPLRRVWPRDDMRSVRVIAPLFVLFVWTIYVIYLVWDDWWYLRFLLPSYPLIMTGTAAIARSVALRLPRELTWVAGAVVLMLGCVQLGTSSQYGVQDHWTGERRYVLAAHMARQMTPRNSLIIANQHMASVRYYGGRVTIRFDSLEANWLDRTVRWLDRRDVETYLLIEDWELDAFRKRFVGERALEALSRAPMAVYREPGILICTTCPGGVHPTSL